jgi:hypothetical protein
MNRDHIVIMMEGSKLVMKCLRCNTSVEPENKEISALVKLSEEFGAKHEACHA